MMIFEKMEGLLNPQVSLFSTALIQLIEIRQEAPKISNSVYIDSKCYSPNEFVVGRSRIDIENAILTGVALHHHSHAWAFFDYINSLAQAHLLKFSFSCNEIPQTLC